jgi:hypothetical protein
VGILNQIASALQLDDDPAITKRINEAARLRLMAHTGVGRFVCGHARFVRGYGYSGMILSQSRFDVLH